MGLYMYHVISSSVQILYTQIQGLMENHSEVACILSNQILGVMMNCICGGKLLGTVHILCTWIHGDGCGEELLFSLPRLHIETLQYTPHTHTHSPPLLPSLMVISLSPQTHRGRGLWLHK